MSSYIYQLYSHMDPLAAGSSPMALIGNDKDYLTTQVSYKLNLKGPSMAIQTSCSTSLVAVCVACQSLWSYALRHGARRRRRGRRAAEEGLFLSGRAASCRPMDIAARSTPTARARWSETAWESCCSSGSPRRSPTATRFTRLSEGAALNNDGSLKVGYTAPSVAGQAQVIAMAQAMAGVDPETVSYVEAHGTATLLGDPIEVAALTQAFSAKTDKKGFCALGSVKSNVGHLASAAGVTGLIKTVLALENGMLPPSLNFKTPNPQIDFADSPFYVNDKLQPWETNGAPRRAGVSSFGVGGTNAHVVLEEAPAREAVGSLAAVSAAHAVGAVVQRARERHHQPCEPPESASRAESGGRELHPGGPTCVCPSSGAGGAGGGHARCGGGA